MDEDDMYRQLEAVGAQFDFGEYEAKAYVTILEHGSLTAPEVAEKTDIPQPRVYDTVRSLADNGLIELHESRPMRVVAVDPEDTFTDIRSTLDDLVTDLSERFRAPARDAEAVSFVTSRQTIRRYLEEVISTAEYELVISLTPSLLSRYEEELIERCEAGVTIELLVAPAVDIPDPEEYDYTKVATTTRARRGVTTPIVAVADGSYSVYTPNDALDAGDESYGVIFNRSELGFLVSAFLNTVVWSSSKKIAEPAGELPFPRRYATMRRCVQDLVGTNGELYATVEGRDVETAEWATVSGRVVDVSAGTNRETASITIDSDDGRVAVGGQLAALEDVEAYEIAVGRDEPPELDLT